MAPYYTKETSTHAKQEVLSREATLKVTTTQTRLTWVSLRHPLPIPVQYFSGINAHKYSFFVRTVSHWNALPNRIVTAKFTALFRTGLPSNIVMLFLLLFITYLHFL